MGRKQEHSKAKRDKKKFDDYRKLQEKLKESYKITNREVTKTKLVKNKKTKRKKLSPIQKTSGGEYRIIQALTNFKIPFTREQEFEFCINPKTGCNLRFDFYIPQLNTCIEFDGLQHYEIVPEFYGKDKVKAKIMLKDQQFRDNIKNLYCSENNIKLLRIKYSEYNRIETILKKYLNV